MKNLKDELDGIEIPTELRARARQGIEQAAKEQKLEPARESKATVHPSKKRKLLAGTLTATITAAAVLFILAVVNPELFSFNTANGEETAKLWYSKWLIIPVLSALIVILLYGTFRVIKQFPERKGLTIFVAFVVVYCLGFSIWYVSNMLQERIIMPLEVEFVKGQEGVGFNVGYVVDRLDEKADIEALIIDGHRIEPTIVSLDGGEHMQPNKRFKNNLYHSYNVVFFNPLEEQLDSIILGDADLTKSEVLFFDGTRLPIEIEHFAYVKDAQGNLICDDFIQAWDWSGGTSPIAEFDLNGETKIKEVIFPENTHLPESYEMKLDDTVIKRVNFNGEKDIDLLPANAVGKRQLRIEIADSHVENPLLHYELPLIVLGEHSGYRVRISNEIIQEFKGLALDNWH